MSPDEYQAAAIRTAAVHPNLEHTTAILCMGLAGEAGEAVDYFKKVIGHGHEPDKNRIRDELGDICWYISVLAYVWNLSFEEILSRNVEKLQARYPNGFTTERSVNRESDPALD